ncbi:NUDIX hydrolase [Aquicoccus sp. G2-2]|uniref:NUDIX hydrolase n=1 Tax=Aquicoccus sp. G2-2 TaxID=3092120 RepID=UPI002AE010A1|nr:NUDIX hydrolase [Aquicoccus sp. G2-2]MEA1114563.1 NUDIX hydrolase [Aquicoccus sp. G2-2]
MIRRFGKAPIGGKRYVFRRGVYAILPKEGELLLTFQAAPFEEVQLPGGGIEPGESPVQALHREVFEETGWKIASPRRLGAFRRFTFMPDYDIWAEKLCEIYVARPVLRLAEPSEAAHTAIWVSVQLAAEMLGNSGDRNFAARYAGGEFTGLP